MQKLFNKILVPVDFSSKSKTAVYKALEIAKQYGCKIHLLHVVTVSPFAAVAAFEGHMAVPYSLIDNEEELRVGLKKIGEEIKLVSGYSIDVDYSVIKGTWNEVIIDFVKEKHFDLVLIGQKGGILKKRKMIVNPDLIAEKANVPVITLPLNRRLIRLFSIVIPITDFLPVRKLIYGVYIATNYNTTIKLLGIENNKTKDSVQYYMEKSYNLIRQNCTVKVEMELIVSDNVAEAVNQFAILQSADLIIVNPKSQTKMPGFFSTLLGNIIQKYSSPPVLTVNPV